MPEWPFDIVELYVAPDGNDAWSGRLREVNAEETDGPLASIDAALSRLRGLEQPPGKHEVPFSVAGAAGPVVIWLRGGRYGRRQPLVITPQMAPVPVTIAAVPGERVTIDGGQPIDGWREETVNGCTAWVVDLPEVAAGEWAFRSLFVNGERRPRPRFPRKGLYRMEHVPGMSLPSGWGNGGYTQFVCRDGDVCEFRNLGDVEVVYVHFWIEERSTIAGFAADTRTVTMTRPSRAPLVGSHGSQLADYYLDNVFEALSLPGQWYLDRAAGRLIYLPNPGETLENTVVSAPRLLQLLEFRGDPRAERFVEHVRFKGITFQHADWRHPGEDELSAVDAIQTPSVARYARGNQASCSQAAADVPGVVRFTGARHCGLEDCAIRNVGWYAVEIADGCTGVRLVGNELTDIGAGGVKLNGAAAGEPEARRTGLNRITDNHIHGCGRIFHAGVGILSMHSFGNLIAHNHIHDLYYSGISCGWVWGYAESVSRDNRIAFNHIHDIGQGLLSDMGGVYLLGVQPGTVVRGNLIHGVTKAHYGGWALYTDEGSSHVVLENNICYDTNGELFHQHYGRENTFRNNILVFGDEAAVAYTRIEPHVGFTFLRNIVVTQGRPVFLRNYGEDGRRIISDLNLFWDASGAPPNLNASAKDDDTVTAFEAWQAAGFDPNSVVADPCFADLPGRDLTLAPGSPAYALGFVPIDTSRVGPRPAGERNSDMGPARRQG